MLIPLGLGMLAPVLLAFGTDAQKREHLPKILSGENYWCQGYSEPGSGSDLASLQLKAARHDYHYVLNGSKLWTTHAHFADHIFCLVRTDGSGRPQQGISFLLVPLDLPGIEVRPIVTMGMSHEVNQVFFTDVRVPLENRVGEEGRGWSYAKYLLEFERGGGMSSGLRLRELDEAVALHAALAAEGEGFDADGAFRKRLARIAIDVRALELTELRLLSVLAAGGAPGPESSVLKLCSVEVEQRVHELCVQMIGHHALVFAAEPSTGVPLPLAVPDYAQAVVGRYLNGRAASIFGGSQEVQRNIIAKAVLGL